MGFVGGFILAEFVLRFSAARSQLRSLTSPHRAYRTQFRISLDLSLSPRFRLQRLHGELRK